MKPLASVALSIYLGSYFILRPTGLAESYPPERKTYGLELTGPLTPRWYRNSLQAVFLPLRIADPAHVDFISPHGIRFEDEFSY